MKIIAPAFIISTLSLGIATPLAAQVTADCPLATITEFPRVRDFITAVDNGNYTQAADAFFLGAQASREDRETAANALEATLAGGRVQSCRVLQHKQYSPDFKIEIFLVETEQKNFYVFAAGIRQQTEWQVVKIKALTDFDEVLQFLR